MATGLALRKRATERNSTSVMLPCCETSARLVDEEPKPRVTSCAGKGARNRRFGHFNACAPSLTDCQEWLKTLAAKGGMSATCRDYTLTAAELLETCEELGVDDENVRREGPLHKRATLPKKRNLSLPFPLLQPCSTLEQIHRRGGLTQHLELKSPLSQKSAAPTPREGKQPQRKHTWP